MSIQFNFQTSTPEAQGIPSEAIIRFLEIIKKEHFELHGLIISRHEKIVAEGYFAPYEEKTLHRLFSASKSINMIAILCLIQEGKLKLSDRMCELLPEKMPDTVSERLSGMTLYHMLTMATGHGAAGFYFFPPRDEDPVSKFFQIPLEYEPGTKFIYNNGVPTVLEYLIRKVSGQQVTDYLEKRIFEPLGIDRHFRFENGGEAALPNLAIETRDMFKLAMLLARHGNWEGSQLIRQDLADLAGQQQMPNGDFDVYPAPPENLSGYGFQMWRNPPGGYRFDGAMGQYAIVLPDYDMVIAMNANERGSYDVLALIWKVLLRSIYYHPIKEDPEKQEKLKAVLSGLDLAPAGCFEGHAEGSFILSEPAFGRKEIVFRENEEGIYLTADRQDSILFRADGKWYPCSMPFMTDDLLPIPGSVLPSGGSELDPSQAVVSAAWTQNDLLEMHFRSSAWLGGYIFRFCFDEGVEGLTVTDTQSEYFLLRSDELKDWDASKGWLQKPVFFKAEKQL